MLLRSACYSKDQELGTRIYFNIAPFPPFFTVFKAFSFSLEYPGEKNDNFCFIIISCLSRPQQVAYYSEMVCKLPP